MSLLSLPEKTANGPSFGPVREVQPGAYQVQTPWSREFHQREVRDALDLLAKGGLVGLGGGAAFGGLLGLKNWLASPSPSATPMGERPEEEITYPVRRRKSRTKLASFPWPDQLVNRLVPDQPQTTTLPSRNQSALGRAWYLTNKYPWFGPAAVTTGIGGAAAGYGLLSRLAKKREKEEGDDELDEARRDYESALSLHRPKSAVDELFDKSAVVSDVYQAIRDTSLPNLAMTVAVPSALVAGAYSYLRSKDRKKKIMEAAIARRNAARSLASPEEIHFEPRPVEEPAPPAPAR